MSRSIRTPSLGGVVAMATAAALTFVAVVPAAAEPTPDLLADFSSAEYSFTLTHSPTNLGWFEVDITNLSTAPISFGLGGALQDAAVMQQLWLEETVEPDQDARFSETVQPGDSYHDQVPFWPGMPYEFFRDLPAPVSIGSYTVPGDWFPVEFDVDGPTAVIEVGYPVVVTPSTARAAETVTISTTVDAGLSSAEVRLELADSASMNFGTEWDWDAADATTLGTLAVTAGHAAGTVTLPSVLDPGVYAVYVGDPATDRWVSGPRIEVGDDAITSNLVIEAGAPRGATAVGANVPVVPVDATTGSQPVSFTFASVSGAGTTTVTTSTTGPTPAGFELNGTYYDLSTTATFVGLVTVCISYAYVEDDPLLSLFHYAGGAWADITTSSDPGLVCGTTSSFSPFALGLPIAAPTYPFTGFYAPVSNTKINHEFAGSIIPFRFGLGGNQGTGVITSVVSGPSACTAGATPTATQAATSPLGIGLQYVRTSATYWWFWQTKTTWAGTCRTFVMTLDDGTTHAATFKFQKITPGGLLRALIRAI